VKRSRSFGAACLAAMIVTGPNLQAQEADVSEQSADLSQAQPSGQEEEAIANVPEGSPSIALCEQVEAAPVIVPKMTIVVLQIDEALGSKISQSGQIFDLSLAEPLMLGAEQIFPAGLKGKGEVIHAKKAGGSGAAGELILTASYLQFGENMVPLRSMKIGRTGGSNIGLATAIGASPLGPIGMLVSGKNTQVEAGTVAEAKLAKSFEVPNSDSSVQEKTFCLEGGTQ